MAQLADLNSLYGGILLKYCEMELNFARKITANGCIPMNPQNGNEVVGTQS
jgi:hypothetical protein